MFRAAVLMLFLLFSLPAMAADKRVALVVGNGAYAQVGALKNPSNDARAIATALEGLGFRVVLGLDQSLAEMRQGLYDFAQIADGAELALFYYAGHGVQVGGQNYLLPTDARLRQEMDLDFATIEMDLILKQLDRAARTKVVILDACRDNPFAAELARSMGTARSSVIGRGLAEIKASGGSLIAFATDPGNVAYDGDGNHSPFTEALLAHLKTPGLEINTLMQRVRTDVYHKTGEKQRPWTTTSLIGEVFLSDPVEVTPDPETDPGAGVQSTPGVATAAAIPVVQAPAVVRSDSALEIAVWQAAEAGGTAEEYVAYLDKFPDGAFSGLARTRIDRLATVASPDAGAGTTPASQPPGGGTAATEQALGLTRSGRREVQRRLKLAGYDPNGVDGIFGPGTRAALSAWQGGAGYPVTGHLDQAQLDALEAQTATAYAAYQAEAAARAKAEAARRKKAAAARKKKAVTYRASAYCSRTGVTGYGSGSSRNTALRNATSDCVNRGGIPNCCSYGARSLN